VKWERKHRPEAVIGGVEQVGNLLGLLPGTLSGGKAFVSLVAKPDCGLSGFDSRHDLIGVTAMNLLDQQIKHNERGLPEHPLTILVPPKWIEGKTCPVQKLVEG